MTDDITTAIETVREALTRWVYPEQNASDPEVQANLDALSTIEAELARMKMLYEWEPPAEDVREVIARLRAERDEAVAALREIAERHEPTVFDINDAIEVADAALARLSNPKEAERFAGSRYVTPEEHRRAWHDANFSKRGNVLIPRAKRCPTCGSTDWGIEFNRCSDPWHSEGGDG